MPPQELEADRERPWRSRMELPQPRARVPEDQRQRPVIPAKLRIGPQTPGPQEPLDTQWSLHRATERPTLNSNVGINAQ